MMNQAVGCEENPFGLEHDKSQTAREQQRVMRKAAMDLLARREHSRLELKRKLDKRFGFNEYTGAVIERLAEEKLLSDERFAENYIHYRSSAGFGPKRIAMELGEKGVSSALCNSLLEQGIQDWLAIASRERQKKFGAAAPEKPGDKARQVRFLQYRGFSFDTIDKLFAT